MRRSSSYPYFNTSFLGHLELLIHQIANCIKRRAKYSDEVFPLDVCQLVNTGDKSIKKYLCMIRWFFIRRFAGFAWRPGKYIYWWLIDLGFNISMFLLIFRSNSWTWASKISSRVWPFVLMSSSSPSRRVLRCLRNSSLRKLDPLRQPELSWAKFYISVIASRPTISWNNFTREPQWKSLCNAVCSRIHCPPSCI